MSRKSCWKVLAFAAVLSAGALALTPAAASARERPFLAALKGNAHLSPTDDPAVLRNDETGKGVATHLGRFTWADEEYADFAAVPGGVAVVATFTMTAANGDELHGMFTSTGTFDETGTKLIIHGSYHFVGGTGRFADATGCGDIRATASTAEGLPFVGELDGSIDY